ncbi:RDD family protein [Vulgatibacter sp.]|uniref:RDD family protein n=1 Tax=Vulgatibacter sp. TaxID=1971226 RepID=UPI003564E182
MLPRVLAKAADLLVAGLFAWIVPTVGGVLGIVYLLLADAMPNGQSPGKRLLGVKAVHVPTRQSCNARHSVIRNLPVAVAFGLALNPILALVAVPIALFELYMVATDPLGVRIGDVFADTQVIDAKVPLETTVPTHASTLIRRAPLAAPDVGDVEAQTRSP